MTTVGTRTAMILGIDAGQTGVRAAVAGRPAVVEAPGVPRLEDPVGPDDVAAALMRAVDRLNGVRGRIAAVGVGLSGFELASEADLRRIAERLRGTVGERARVTIAGDGVTSLLGALGRRPGVVVAGGTGVVALGHDGHGDWARADGWGSLLGDDGSAFAIGAAGLRAALRAFDARAGGSEPLRALAEAAFGAVDAIPLAVHRQGPAARTVAAFAPAVATAARAGDPVAEAIWARAGEDLAIAVAAACAPFPPYAAVDVACVGNLWKAGDLLTEPFRRALAERRPGATLVAPAGTSLDGAAELARGAADAAPRTLVWRD